MKGILLASHGQLAKGMADTATMFFGTDIPQMDYLCLSLEDDPDTFEEKMEEKIKELDTGEGVIVFCDLFGGTPAHKSTRFLSDSIKVITGMNASMIMELLGSRMATEASIDELIAAGQNGITEWKVAALASDDDFF